MNMNMLFNMFTRLVMRKAMNWGINKGVGTMSRARTKPPAAGQPGTTNTTTAAQPGKRHPKQTADLAKKMRTLSRLTRR